MNAFDPTPRRRRVAAAIVPALMVCVMLFLDPAQAGAAAVRLVALGDFLTAGYGIAAKDAFPAKLESALKAKGLEVRIENAGVSGDTTTSGLARLDWSVPEGTQGVVLELGANDMLRGIDPKIARAALEKIIVNLQARKIDILLCGMKAARNLGGDYVRDFDAIYPDLARKYDLMLYPFFLDGVAQQARLTLPDGLHPTAAGVDVMVAGILPQAEEFVAKIRARTGP